MTEIIERLEGLTGPCRETDALIHELVFGHNTYVIYCPKTKAAVGCHASTDDHNYVQILQYTASIDQALNNIPEGCDWLINSRSNFASVCEQRHLGLGIWDNSGPPSANIAIAVCIAIFRARTKLKKDE